MTSAFFAMPGILAPLQGFFRLFSAGTVPVRPMTRSVALPQLPACQRIESIKRIANSSIRTSGSGIISGVHEISRPVGELATNSITPASRAAPGTRVMHVATTARTARVASTARITRVVRMARIVEAGQAPASVGRMVISGRMADVCAELDRLALREAALH